MIIGTTPTNPNVVKGSANFPVPKIKATHVIAYANSSQTKNPNVPMIVFLVTFIGLSGNCSRAAVMAIFMVCDLPPWISCRPDRSSPICATCILATSMRALLGAAPELVVNGRVDLTRHSGQNVRRRPEIECVRGGALASRPLHRHRELHPAIALRQVEHSVVHRRRLELGDLRCPDRLGDVAAGVARRGRADVLEHGPGVESL